MVQSVTIVPDGQVLVLTLTVDPAIQPGETAVTLAWTAGNGDIIADAVGNTMDDFSALSVDTTAVIPAVVLVGLADASIFDTSFIATNTVSFIATDTVSIVVNFSSSVTVTGTPQLALEVGGPTGVAQYVSGSPGTELIFNYIVAAGHNTAALDYLSVNALSLNSGSIESTPTPTSTVNVPADLTLPTPGEFNSLSGNFFSPLVLIDTIAPAVPVIDGGLIAGDDHISLAERMSDSGVLVTGSHDADSAIILCAGATDATDPTCAGGLTYEATVSSDLTVAISWSYGLDSVDITEIGGGAVTLTAIATDAAGNTAVSPGRGHHRGSLRAEHCRPGCRRRHHHRRRARCQEPRPHHQRAFAGRHTGHH